MIDPVEASLESLPDESHPMTFFAPAGRQNPLMLKKLSTFTLDDPIVKVVLQSVGTFVLVLNRERQILAVNQEVLDALEREQQSDILGRRPGEAFGCERVSEGPDGCGTSQTCRYCGAVIALLHSQEQQKPCSRECLMTVLEGDKPVAREFSVRATPLQIDGEELTVMVLRDVSPEKRRNALERVFLHDFNNILTGLVGLSELAAQRPQGDTMAQVQDVIRLLSREMGGQRLLLEAEQGDLAVDLSEVSVGEIFGEIEELFSIRMLHLGRNLILAPPNPDVCLQTDKRLVIRILTNMVKNAVEATERGCSVRLSFDLSDGLPVFETWNNGQIDRDTAAQIFKRTFSTSQETGRGLGTYSMKLLGEFYLKGKVWFASAAKEGTSFYFALPKEAFPETISPNDRFEP